MSRECDEVYDEALHGKGDQGGQLLEGKRGEPEKGRRQGFRGKGEDSGHERKK